MIFPRSLPIFAGICLGTAQSLAAPAASGAPPSPQGSAATHAHVVTLDEFVTSATPFLRNQVDLAQSTTVLAGTGLALKLQSTIGETLAAETGMSATSFGPGASRPIIRGLGGNRIRLLENSAGTIDASVTSPDHAVSIEPFLIDRVEVVRGPASLLYGSSAVGGIVNVITHRIETEMPAERVRGGAEIRFGSGSDEQTGGAMIDLALVHTPSRALILHIDGFRRSTDDMRIPGFAESARVREAETAEALEHGEPAPDFAHGRLPNSSLTSEGGAVGLSFVGRWLQIGASYSGLDSNYGVPGHAHGHDEEEAGSPGEEDVDGAAGVRIELRQRRADVQAELRADAGLLHAVRFRFGLASYLHREREPDGTVGTTFTNDGHEARLELLHGRGNTWNGSLGLQISESDFSASGEEAFLPPSLTREAALFIFEELVREPFTWHFGARVEQTRLQPFEGDRRVTHEPGGSLGAVWKPDGKHTVTLSIAHTARAPKAQELLANGPHAGTGSYEIGSLDLGPEKSLGIELNLRRRTEHLTASLSLHANRFDGYIFEKPAGLVAIDHDGEWKLTADGDDDGDGLPVYEYVQRDAMFHGVEVEVLWHLHESIRHAVDLRLAADHVRGRAGRENLPRIPAARVSVGAAWTSKGWSAGADSQFVFDQNRSGPDETPSAGYALLNAHAGYGFSAGRTTWNLFLRGTNLLNHEARPHPSFVKDLAPLGGRAFTLGLKMAF